MRISSLIQILMVMIAFGVYFYGIEPVIKDQILVKYSIFGLIFFSLTYLSKKIEGRFKIGNKRIDNQLSVWIVVGMIFIPLLMGLLN
ncbi:hypothetical protein [Sporosarcina sp. NPDC096371]|uniref:hypothetical protein n=1 Tax=Sporosarcina sp. NPDC096371 TaxID=3364530 RepID=UPI00381F6CF5